MDTEGRNNISNETLTDHDQIFVSDGEKIEVSELSLQIINQYHNQLFFISFFFYIQYLDLSLHLYYIPINIMINIF
jgi:hypothetical protein